MKKFIIFILIFSPFVIKAQQYSDAQIKAAYIYNFMSNIEWTNEKELKVFKIGVYGADTTILPFLKELSKTKDLRGLPIKIIYSTDIDDIIKENIQLIYISEDKRDETKAIYYEIVAKPILLVSDNSVQTLYVMLNFKYSVDKKISFEINKKNVEGQNFIILPKLLVHGSTELDLKQLYKLKEEELSKEREIVLLQEQKLKEQQSLINQQLKSIEEQNLLIGRRKKSIDSLVIQMEKQNIVLKAQSENLAKLNEEIIFQQQILRQKVAILDAQTDSIEIQKQRIEKQKTLMNENLTKLEEMNSEIAERGLAIENQKKELSNLHGTVENQKKYMGFMAVIIILVLGFIIYVYKSYRQKKRFSDELYVKNQQIQSQSEEISAVNHELTAQRDELIQQKEYIEHQNEYITDSIQYATKIQQALLPSLNEVSEFFENFVLYRPKDIVSGDFYWYFHLRATDDNPEKLFFAVVDCTGHGVPGSLMSMIGSRLLSEILIEKKIFVPSQILEKLNHLLIKTLKQQPGQISDGMDICMCSIEKNGNKRKVTFCGAKRPLIVYYSKQNKADRIKGSHKGIGGYSSGKNLVFEDIELELEKNDILYLTTDGFIDQNNSLRKRFGTMQFIEKISDISKLSMSEQQKKLENELNFWQKDNSQRDDITIWAIKL